MPIAQLAEQTPYKGQVVGSNPTRHNTIAGRREAAPSLTWNQVIGGSSPPGQTIFNKKEK